VGFMSASLKRYRIESAHSSAVQQASSLSDSRIDEILTLVQDLRRHMEGSIQTSPVQTSAAQSVEIMETYKREIGEIYRLREELDTMKQAIESTKREIASLYKTEAEGKGMGRVAGELDAVVQATATATNTILAAAEDIETNASMLRSAGAETGNNDCIGAILEKTVTLFEACNFQDLTGQRINKIVNVLKFVEEKLDRMIEVWGGLDELKDLIGPIDIARVEDEKSLLNGPKLEDDAGHVSQDDIDSLFP
jgi:chemotaxis protein CheZ